MEIIMEVKEIPIFKQLSDSILAGREARVQKLQETERQILVNEQFELFKQTALEFEGLFADKRFPKYQEFVKGIGDIFINEVKHLSSNSKNRDEINRIIDIMSAKLEVLEDLINNPKRLVETYHNQIKRLNKLKGV